MVPRSIRLETGGIVALVKTELNIKVDNRNLTDEQIGQICRRIAEDAPDTTYCFSGKPIFGEMGIAVMLSVSLYVFPWHYQKYELWQRN